MSNIWHKLNLKEQREILVSCAPASFEAAIDELEDVRVHRTLAEGAADSTSDPVSEPVSGPVSEPVSGPVPITFLLAFVTEREEIGRLAKIIRKRAEGDAIIWMAYPKGSSKRYKCDFNRDTGWSPLGKVGFEGVRQVAIDEDWSALRFRRVEYIKRMTRDPKRRMTET